MDSSIAHRRAHALPRKVIVGSLLRNYIHCPDSLEGHLELAENLIAELDQRARATFDGRGCDLIVLPEHALRTGARDNSPAAQAVTLEGAVQERLAGAARAARSNLVLPMVRALDRTSGHYENTALVFDRGGVLLGHYTKYHSVVPHGSDVIERGLTPGNAFPVFDLDFGRIGVQICFDVNFEDGWAALAEQGAELIAWPSMSAATVLPRRWSQRFGYYILGSNNSHNASLYEPDGVIAQQIREPEEFLLREVDLSWMLLPWSFALKNGRIFDERFPGKVGYHYECNEDVGLFWSDDPERSIGSMTDELGLESLPAWLERNVRITDAARADLS